MDAGKRLPYRRLHGYGKANHDPGSLRETIQPAFALRRGRTPCRTPLGHRPRRCWGMFARSVLIALQSLRRLGSRTNGRHDRGEHHDPQPRRRCEDAAAHSRRRTPPLHGRGSAVDPARCRRAQAELAEPREHHPFALRAGQRRGPGVAAARVPIASRPGTRGSTTPNRSASCSSSCRTARGAKDPRDAPSCARQRCPNTEFLTVSVSEPQRLRARAAGPQPAVPPFPTVRPETRNHPPADPLPPSTRRLQPCRLSPITTHRARAINHPRDRGKSRELQPRTAARIAIRHGCVRSRTTVHWIRALRSPARAAG